MTVDLLAQRLPVKLHERMLLRDLAYHSLGDSRAVSQSCEMQLPHFAASAHVVHQVKSIPFAANESHTAHPATSNMSVV